MSTMASQINSLRTVDSIIYLSADQRKHQSSASLAFVRGIHRRPVNSPRKGPVTRKMFPFDDVIMKGYVCNIYTETEMSGWQPSYWYWNLSSTSPLNIRTVFLITFPFQCNMSRQLIFNQFTCKDAKFFLYNYGTMSHMINNMVCCNQECIRQWLVYHIYKITINALCFNEVLSLSSSLFL